jgi:Arc/MetJ-type ribon-helix-helix transcriptional regulator
MGRRRPLPLRPMPLRTLRIDDPLWERLRKTAAREQRRSMSETLRVALTLGLDELDRRWAVVHGD